MSQFLNGALRRLTPYTPGEQPRNQAYIKLNTNESPYPPSPGVLAALNRAEGENLRLYSDPEAVELREALAARYGVERENVFVANGSDEALSFAFLAYAADGRGVAFPDISYGFYAVFARLAAYQSGRCPCGRTSAWCRRTTITCIEPLCSPTPTPPPAWP